MGKQHHNRRGVPTVDPERATQAVEMFLQGASLRKIAKELMGWPVTRRARRWIIMGLKQQGVW